jgi:hypothetical protein
MEETRDQIAVLLRQERAQYSCADYMAEERARAVDTSVMDMLQECAAVVSDLSVRDTYIASTSSSPAMVKTADGVVKSPSAVCVRELESPTTESNRSTNRSSSGDTTTTNPTKTLPTFGFWRQQMFDWACMVVDSFGMDRDVVAHAFSILDRFIGSQSSRSRNTISRDDFQLYCMTCLYLAIKVMIPYPRKLGVQALVDMSRGFYSPEDIAVTEMDILTKLQWHIHPPTAIGFCRLFWTLFPVEPSFDMQMTCATLTEITVQDSLFVAYKPSAVALAAVLHAARLNGKSGAVKDFRDNLQELVADNQESKFVHQQLEKLYCQ